MYDLTDEKTLRQFALEKATLTAGKDDGPEQVIARARAYEAYLAGNGPEDEA